jgi:PAS domain S-box-containing protein
MTKGAERVSNRNASENNKLSTKNNSLLHILNGEEEFILNQQGMIMASNLEAVNVTGYEEYEIMGKHISMFYRTDEADKASADLEKAQRLGSTVVTGLRVKKRGVIFWAKMKIKFVSAGQPEDPCFTVILQDATHRAISKERIRTLRDEYLSIFNNPFVGSFKFKMETYAIQLCNQKALDIIGVDTNDGLRLDSVFASFAQFEIFTATLRSEKKVEGFKFQIRNGQANENWAMVSARYFEQQGFVEGVLFDISEQHRQMIELQRINAELDNFIYHASHDLRSPLTSIMGLVNLGLTENSIGVMHDYLGMISDRIQHLDVLLKDLISVSYNNAVAQESESFQFKAEAEEIITLLRNPNRPIDVSVDVWQAHDFKTDPVRLRAILRNLLSNAFKYFNPETAQPFIQLSIRVRPSHCAILLRDNGIGIHPDFKQRVYGMFFRATERSSGSGLGLYIVKSMVEKLNGRISFESTLNMGTTFLLTLPNQEKQSFVQPALNTRFILTSDQIELVENSWDYVLMHAQDAGAIFYQKLFSIDPGLRFLFKGEISTQSQKLVAMITFTVHKLNTLDEILADVSALGVLHKNKSVQPHHYAMVAEALLWTLENALGKNWNSDVKAAWEAVYSALASTMMEAASTR